jgi:hypothetical protein
MIAQKFVTTNLVVSLHKIGELVVAGDGASLHMDKLGPRAGMQVGRRKEVSRVGRGWPSQRTAAFSKIKVEKA